MRFASENVERIRAQVRERSTDTPMETQVQSPINLENWIEENREKFKPPVSNRYLYDGRDFFVMVIKGPNARNDFHQVDSEEYFYQLKGDIKVRIRGKATRSSTISCARGNVLHSAERSARAVRPRTRSAWSWNGGARLANTSTSFSTAKTAARIVEDIDFDCGDIVEHFSKAMLDFWNDDARRTCKKCGQKVPKPEPVKPF